MGTIKIYTTSITARPEVRKRIQRILFILESKNIQHEVIDITQSNKDELEFLKTHCNTSQTNNSVPLLPQIFNDETHCGGYEEFDNAVELEELYSFLKLQAVPSKEKDENVVAVANGAGHDENVDGETNENGEEPEAVVEEDPDAAWERRAKAKKLQKEKEAEEKRKLEEEEAEQPANQEEPEESVVEEDPDAAWERRAKAKKLQKEKEAEEKRKLEEEAAAAEETAETPEDENEDPDVAWERRMKAKRQKKAEEDDEETPEEAPEKNAEEPDDQPVDDDDAWERRRKAKKAAEKDDEPVDVEEKEGEEAEDEIIQEEEKKPGAEEDEEIVDDDVEIEDEDEETGGQSFGSAKVDYLTEVPDMSRRSHASSQFDEGSRDDRAFESTNVF